MDDQVITAIPTLYSGVQFKSRIEARFAEYLDEKKVQWKYEPYWKWGSYQPDFYLVQFDLYIEIKPRKFTEEIRMFIPEIDKCTSLWMAIDQYGREGWCQYYTHNITEERLKLYVDEISFDRLSIAFLVCGHVSAYIKAII